MDEDRDEDCPFGEHDWVFHEDAGGGGYYLCDICDDWTDEI